MSSIERILVVPRWGGTTADDWYPWLVGQVAQPRIVLVDLPQREAPTIAGCVEAFGAALDAGDPETTLLVGHSVSGQGWLHTLAAKPERRVVGLLAVAGWWTVDSPWPPLQPWIEAQHDLAAIRRACPQIRVLISENDPYTADHETNAKRWRERLDAEVTLHPGAKHFNAAEEPAVLAALQVLLG